MTAAWVAAAVVLFLVALVVGVLGYAILNQSRRR